jgi:predicted site-specific integrase-resolvase
MEVEKLDLANVIEVDKIRKILVQHPDLLSMFELMIIVANKRLNKEEVDNIFYDEPEPDEPNLSDHESDNELPDPKDDY